MKTVVTSLVLALLLAGCSDDGASGNNDSASPNDGSAADVAVIDQGSVSPEAGSPEAGAPDAAGPDAASTKKAFGETCTDNAECESGLCHKFGDGTEACTQSCGSDGDCPSGSQGQKCNNQGVCRV